jgi:predicted metal-dependent hydrolase
LAYDSRNLPFSELRPVGRFAALDVCEPGSSSIRLNTDLAKKPRECLEYIVVHEMAHLLVRKHDDRFGAVMDGCLPDWRVLRQTLNSTPLAHTKWAY